MLTVQFSLDHFLEADVYDHSMELLLRILEDPSLHGILIDLGLPIMHRGCRYNSRAIILNGKLLCLRPKIYLANDGYVCLLHESRSS